MTHLRSRILLPLLVLAQLALVAVTAAPSGAADAFYCTSSCTFTDAAKDAPAKADVLGGHFVAGPKAFNVRLRVRDLKRTGSFVFGAGLGGWGVNYRVVKKASSYQVTSRTISEVKVYPAKACPAATVAWNARKNVIQARFPYACSGSSGDPIMDGVDFHAQRATDHFGKVYYRP